jgi:hypothetical protein
MGDLNPLSGALQEVSQSPKLHLEVSTRTCEALVMTHQLYPPRYLPLQPANHADPLSSLNPESLAVDRTCRPNAFQHRNGQFLRILRASPTTAVRFRHVFRGRRFAEERDRRVDQHRAAGWSGSDAEVAVAVGV